MEIYERIRKENHLDYKRLKRYSTAKQIKALLKHKKQWIKKDFLPKNYPINNQ